MIKWFKSKGPVDAAQDDLGAESLAELLERADARRERHDAAGALELYRQALRIAPQRVYASYWIATLYEELGELDAAAEHCERGLALDPDQIGMLLRRASIAKAAFDPARALACYEQVARLDPQVEKIDAMLADQYCMLGRHEAAAAAFDRALALYPDSVQLQSDRLFILNYMTLLSPEALFDEHRRWGVRHEGRLRPLRVPHSCNPDPGKRLRIGYVSPDLRDHPVGLFLEPLLQAHDRNAFEIHCFDTSRVAEDLLTARIKPRADTWHKVGDLNDEALAATIRGNGIDILLDLSGHTAWNRLLVFARKPAPVQVTWLGYLNTTGLTAMDYRLTDSYLDPVGSTEHLHTETLFRIRNHTCFKPAPGCPPVGALPAAQRKAITFGSVNQWPKVTGQVKDTWAAVLKRVERSRLVVVARGGQNPDFRHGVVADFVRRGVRVDQIEVLPALPLERFLNLLGDIDLALDPFPYGGGATTMQSLWMGIPVVTLAGATARARNSIGPLVELGLGELVAATPDDYAEIAARLARDLPWLRETRSTLRERMAASPLTDGKRFAEQVEMAMTTMWRNYCAGREASPK